MNAKRRSRRLPLRGSVRRATDGRLLHRDTKPNYRASFRARRALRAPRAAAAFCGANSLFLSASPVGAGGGHALVALLPPAQYIVYCALGAFGSGEGADAAQNACLVRRLSDRARPTRGVVPERGHPVFGAEGAHGVLGNALKKRTTQTKIEKQRPQAPTVDSARSRFGYRSNPLTDLLNSKAHSDLVYRGNSPPDLRKQSIEAKTHTNKQNNTRNTLSRQANLRQKILKRKVY